jgi:hypothetical protein
MTYTALVTFWIVVCASVVFMRSRPESTITRAAFTWVGPRQIVGESWAAFQLRWAMYSLSWLVQISAVASALWITALYVPSVSSHTWFSVAGFALALGAGMPALATIGFFAKAGKAKYLGPNPVLALRVNRPI